MIHALAILCAYYVGYQWGRNNRLERLMGWAEAATEPGWRTWRFWPAAPIVLTAIAYLWVVHPRRSLANVRAWKAYEESQT